MGTEVPSGPGQYSDAHGASVGSPPHGRRGGRPLDGGITERPGYQRSERGRGAVHRGRRLRGVPFRRAVDRSRRSGQGRVRRRPGGSLRVRWPLFGSSGVVLRPRAPGVNLRPCPAATSSTARTRRRGRSTRFGDRRTTSMTRSSRSRSTASIGNRIPNVCTDRERSSRSPSFGSSSDRPRSPRARSLRVCGTSTMNGPNRSRRIPTTLPVRSEISCPMVSQP
jgi:hypothetical protein